MWFDVYANVMGREDRAWAPIVERVEAGSYTAAISSVYFKLAADSGVSGKYLSYQVISAVRVDEGAPPSGALNLEG